MVSIIIPTLNAGRYIGNLLESLHKQSIDSEIIIIDSTSADKTAKIAESFNVKTIVIKREDFNHGRTRNLAQSMAKGEILIYITQDAVPVNEYAIENLIKPFYKDEKIGAVYGRQLPRQKANPIESHARLFNYPPINHVKTMGDASKLGLKTVFISNSFAAYRRYALIDVGWFPSNTIMSEDTYVGAKMILRGWKIAYRADACVYHSHDYTPLEEFNRYFDIGVFHAREPWIRICFGQAEGEGLRYFWSELRYLWNKNLFLIPSSILRTILKLAGYRLGIMEQYFPIWLKQRLSMNKDFWRFLNKHH